MAVQMGIPRVVKYCAETVFVNVFMADFLSWPGK